MKKSELEKIKNTAIKAAKASGKILRHYASQNLKINHKQNESLVTQADLEAEAAALKILRKETPDFLYLTEESHNERGELGSFDGGVWVVDPLDGTTNFVHRFPMYCVSIAAVYNKKVQVGVIYHPVFDELYVAVRGQGAWLNGTPLKVSDATHLKSALLTTGFAYNKDKRTLNVALKLFETLSIESRGIRRPGSAALDLAYVARGVFDGFWEKNLSPWDIAAGSLLVEEAGGKVTSFAGKPYDWLATEILAAPSKIHTQVSKILRTTPRR